MPRFSIQHKMRIGAGFYLGSSYLPCFCLLSSYSAAWVSSYEEDCKLVVGWVLAEDSQAISVVVSEISLAL